MSAQDKLRVVLSSLDAAALEALSSKGLLRRAHKDLERGVAIHADREENGIVYFKFEQYDVGIPETGPAKAKCSCPAAGMCQHILAAVLFLQREAGTAGDAAAESAERELLEFSREQLESWAGKVSFRAALEIAAKSPAEIDSSRGLVIRFPAMNAQCHYASGGGLDGMIVSGNAKDEKRIAAAAVIAFQKSRGVAWDIPRFGEQALEEAAGVPRSRSEVLEIAVRLFTEMLDNGLARLSASTQQRLATLAVSALGVNLPRLSLALRGLSDECAQALARDANSDLGRMLARIAQAYALCTALQQDGAGARADLVGWHRTRYEELGSLELIGVSAWPWRTASGYTGLTLLFWDPLARQWNSWSESRPTGQQLGFHAIARYSQPGPWDGSESPRQLASSSFRLMNARRNAANRLSGSGKSRVQVSGESKLLEHGVPVATDWEHLAQAVDSRVGVGLTESNPLDAIFAVRPAAWVRRAFNPVSQLFSWWLADSQGRPLVVEIGFDAFSELCIKYLETADANSMAGTIVIGRVEKSVAKLTLRPYSIHRNDGEVIHLWLDTLAANQGQQAMPAPGPEGEGFEEEEESEEPGGIYSPALNGLFGEVDDGLLIAAEAGVAGLNPLRIERLGQIAARAERFGLQALAAALRNVIAQPQATVVLRCAYVSQLHRRAMAGSA